MPNAKTQITDQIETQITGLTTTGTNVFRARVYPHNEKHLPSLNIVPGAQEDDDENRTMGNVLPKVGSWTIEARVKDASNYENEADTISAEVEAAILANQNLGGLVQKIEVTSTETDYDGSLEKPVAILLIECLVFYRVLASDPNTIIS